MPVIDLTHRIENDMPVFPGTPKPVLIKSFIVERDGFAETRLTMMSHTGTHMDAPAHMLGKGSSVDQLPAERFIGQALCLDVSHLNAIALEDLIPYQEQISQVRFVLFSCRWDEKWGHDAYFHSFPVLTEPAAAWLLQFNLSGIGADCISFDQMSSTDYPIHRVLLGHGLLLIENLTGIATLTGKTFDFIAAPLHFTDADGAPVRAFAITR
ncbi:MAG TPA: hydrolase [Bacteroidales bacterium]|nr:MAG: hydrolase [Bacteroidetes bacterium GWE2_42_24]OFY29449.1 MAG: hydrolase [Bacteroidetes bacterium GWF2_43_11]HBZ67893.1 hydrolase [Bacteroidales bacterium]